MQNSDKLVKFLPKSLSSNQILLIVYCQYLAYKGTLVASIVHVSNADLPWCTRIVYKSYIKIRLRLLKKSQTYIRTYIHAPINTNIHNIQKTEPVPSPLFFF